jgi:cysteine synthase B
MPFDSSGGIASLDRTPVASLVGRTPLVRLAAFEPRAGVELYAKLESQNPGGSVKDRAALAMIEDGERRGELTRDRVLLDATSGNTGIAYAMIAATRGYRVRLCVPANVTAERLALLRAYGADFVLTDPMEGTDGAIREARRLHAEDPDRYFYPDQYNNPANWRAHYETTAPELIEQTSGRLTHFVAGLGTSGTFVGSSRRLREWRASVRLISVQPDSPLHGLEGLKHMATAIVPGIYDASLADEDRRVSTEDAYNMTRRLAREAGLLVGPSSGAALHASLDVARDLTHAVVVTIFPDGGERYLTERFWNDARPSLELTPDVEGAIRRHGVATYPDECCGALLGPRAGMVDETLALDNQFDGERRRRFAVTPDDYRRAERHATDTGRELVGFYHSHPDHPAVPSAFDLEHAWPNLTYAIVSVRAGRCAELRSWRLRPDRSRYDEEIVTISTRRSPSCP